MHPAGGGGGAEPVPKRESDFAGWLLRRNRAGSVRVWLPGDPEPGTPEAAALVAAADAMARQRKKQQPAGAAGAAGAAAAPGAAKGPVAAVSQRERVLSRSTGSEWACTLCGTSGSSGPASSSSSSSPRPDVARLARACQLSASPCTGHECRCHRTADVYSSSDGLDAPGDAPGGAGGTAAVAAAAAATTMALNASGAADVGPDVLVVDGSGDVATGGMGEDQQKDDEEDEEEEVGEPAAGDADAPPRWEWRQDGDDEDTGAGASTWQAFDTMATRLCEGMFSRGLKTVSLTHGEYGKTQGGYLVDFVALTRRQNASGRLDAIRRVPRPTSSGVYGSARMARVRSHNRALRQGGGGGAAAAATGGGDEDEDEHDDADADKVGGASSSKREALADVSVYPACRACVCKQLWAATSSALRERGVFRAACPFCKAAFCAEDLVFLRWAIDDERERQAAADAAKKARRARNRPGARRQY